MRIIRGKQWGVMQGDCLQRLKELPDNSIDSVVTDPPYELGFMGKKWDASGIAYSVPLWTEVLRVLKPGGHMLAFGGTRTYHRMTCAIEDAGFEIRDSLHWLYGTGFPKSLNIGEGQGTALKPGHEPICMARKPLDGTVAANVQRYGTGALNIDASRIGNDVVGWGGGGRGTGDESTWSVDGGTCGLRAGEARPVAGRWPANVILDEGAAAELDAQSGERPGMPKTTKRSGVRTTGRVGFAATIGGDDAVASPGYGDSGGASRFFYVAKPSRKERDLGCQDLPSKSAGEATDREEGTDGLNSPRAGAGRTGGAKNHHPTVKPIQLMQYLVRLVTPKGGVVLDPFTGSGTTGIAAVKEGFSFIGFEREDEYISIIEARMRAVESETLTEDAA